MGRELHTKMNISKAKINHIYIYIWLYMYVCSLLFQTKKCETDVFYMVQPSKIMQCVGFSPRNSWCMMPLSSVGGIKNNTGMLYLNCVEKTEKHGDLTRKFPCIPTGISSGFRRKIPGEVVGWWAMLVRLYVRECTCKKTFRLVKNYLLVFLDVQHFVGFLFRILKINCLQDG